MIKKENILSHITDNPYNELKEFSGKFISIALCIKYPDRLYSYLEHLVLTCYDIKNFEVNIAIPNNEDEISKITDVVNIFRKKYELLINIKPSPYDYLTAMTSVNILLNETSDKSTYFFTVHSDRYRYANKNWDLIIKQYIGSLPDDMFFLRGANFSKYLKSRKSAHDAFYYPEQIAIYTRKYIENIGGFLESHTGHDAVEIKQYFIDKNKQDIFKRDILMPDIMYSDKNNIVSKETGKKNFYERYYINGLYYKFSFTKKNLEKIKKKSSYVLIEHVIWKHKLSNYKIVEEKNIIKIVIDNKIFFKENTLISFNEYIKEKISFYLGNNHGFNFVSRFYFFLKYKSIFKIFRKIVFYVNHHTQIVENAYVFDLKNMYSYLVFQFFKLLTNIFLTEQINNQVEGLFRGNEFMEVLHSDTIKKVYKSKNYKKGIEHAANALRAD